MPNLLDFNGDLQLIKAVLSIVMIDLVLSGDNAVVIGMASRRLPPVQQRRAMFYGAAGAVGLRVLFTALAALLLGIPLVQAVGGLVLVWIAYKLLRDEERTHAINEGSTLPEAVRTIVLADVIMSLDNILAVGGAAHGNLWLLIFGLALSMPIILFGSRLVALLLNRLTWLVYVGAAVLAYTAAEMILKDGLVKPFLPAQPWFHWGFIIVVTVGTLVFAFAANRRALAQQAERAPVSVGAGSEVPRRHVGS